MLTASQLRKLGYTEAGHYNTSFYSNRSMTIAYQKVKMSSSNSKKLNMSNSIAGMELKKKLHALSSEHHRQLVSLHRDKLELRYFIRNLKKCDSDQHPNALRQVNYFQVLTLRCKLTENLCKKLSRKCCALNDADSFW